MAKPTAAQILAARNAQLRSLATQNSETSDNKARQWEAYAREAIADMRSQGVEVSSSDEERAVRETVENGAFNFTPTPAADFSGVQASVDSTYTEPTAPRGIGDYLTAAKDIVLGSAKSQRAGITADAAQGRLEDSYSPTEENDVFSELVSIASDSLSRVSWNPLKNSELLVDSAESALAAGMRGIGAEGRVPDGRLLADVKSAERDARSLEAMTTARAEQQKEAAGVKEARQVVGEGGAIDHIARAAGSVIGMPEQALPVIGAIGGSLAGPGGTAVGSAVGATPMAKIAYDAAYAEARNEFSATREEAQTYAAAMTAVEFGMEAVSGGAGKVASLGLKSLTKEAAKEALEKKIAGRIGRTLAGAAVEGGTEIATELTGDAVREGMEKFEVLSSEDSREKLKTFNAEQSASRLDRVLQSGLAGSMAGGTIAGGVGSIEYAMQQGQRQARVNAEAERAFNEAQKANADRRDTSFEVRPVPKRESPATTPSDEAQMELFPETTPGPTSELPSNEPKAQPGDSPLDDPLISETKRATLRAFRDKELARVNELKEKQANTDLIGTGYEFDDADAAELAKREANVAALNNDIGRWEGGAARQDSLPLRERAQPSEKKPKPIQTRGGDVVYQPDGSVTSNVNDKLAKEVEAVAKAQAAKKEADAKKAADAGLAKAKKDYKAARTAAINKAVAEDPDTAIATMRAWDEANPEPTTAEPLVEASPTVKRVEQLRKQQESQKKGQDKMREGARIKELRRRNPDASDAQIAAMYDAQTAGQPAPQKAAPAAPTAAPVAAPAAGTPEATIADAASKMGLGMTAEETVKYGSSGKAVVKALSKDNSQTSVDILNLIKQGKLILAPNEKSVGRPDSSFTDENGVKKERKAEFDPEDGKLYLYTDKIKPGDVTATTIRALHEATHGGQFNDREGRPSLMRHLLGDSKTSEAAKTIRKLAASNKLAGKALSKAQADTKARKGDTQYEDAELVAYFVGEVADSRGGMLGSAGGVVRDITTAARSFARDKLGRNIDISIGDLNTAAMQTAGELVQTDLKPVGGDSLGMIMGESAPGAAQARAEGRGFVDPADGKWKFITSDAAAAVNMTDTQEEKLRSGGMILAEDVLSHDELFDSYPYLKNFARLKYNPSIPTRGASYNEKNGEVQIGSDVLAGLKDAQPWAKAVLLHELQHGIQGIEDFARGGNIDQFLTAADRKAVAAANYAETSLAKQASALRDLLPMLLPKERNAVRDALEGYEEGVLTYKEAFDDILGITSDFTSNQDVQDWWHRTDIIAQQAEKAIPMRDAAQRRAYDKYMTLRGEQEAYWVMDNAERTLDELPPTPLGSKRYEGEARVSQKVGDLKEGSAQTAFDALDAIPEDERTPAQQRAYVQLSSDVASPTSLGMAEETAAPVLNKHVLPSWLSAMLFANKGTSRSDFEIYEHFATESASKIAEAQAVRGKYGIALDQEGAAQNKTAEQLDKEIGDAIDAIEYTDDYTANKELLNQAMAPFGEAGQRVRELRDMIDEMSLDIVQQRAEAAANGKPLSQQEKNLYSKVIANLGKYTHRQYAAGQGTVGQKYSSRVWSDYNKVRTGKGRLGIPARITPAMRRNYQIVADATKRIIDDKLYIPEDIYEANADTVNSLYDTWGEKGVEDTDAKRDELLEIRDRVNGDTGAMEAKATQLAKELLSLTKENSPITAYYRGGKLDSGILQKRSDIPVELRTLMGEITDPSMRLVLTASKMAEFVARNKMLLALANNNGGDLLPAGTVAPDGWTKLKGDNYGPLNGWSASPNMTNLIGDVQQQLATFEQAVAMAGKNPAELVVNVGRWALGNWGKVAGFSKFMQIVWNQANFAYNLLGGAGAMMWNGNFNPTNFAKAAKVAYPLVRHAGSPHLSTPESREIIGLNLHETAFIGELKGEQFRDLRLLTEKMAGVEKGKHREWISNFIHKTGAAAKETYAMMDVIFKIANFYHEQDMLTEYHKLNEDGFTKEQIDREAAERTRRTNFTFSRVAPALKAVERGGFSAFLPYMHEVMRTQATTIMQTASEVKQASEANTPEARSFMATRASTRIMGQAVYWTGVGLVSKVMGEMMFGDDDEEARAKRSLLPEFVQDQDFFVAGLDEDGQAVVFNLARFDPIGPATDIMRSIMHGEASAKSVGTKLFDMYVAPRIVPQVWNAMQVTFGDTKVKRVPTAQQVAPESFSAFLDLGESLGIDRATTKAWFNVAETTLPGFMGSWRDNNARPAWSEDTVGNAFRVASFAGVSMYTMDMNKPLMFGAIDYNKSVTNGRRDLADYFNDNADRSEDETVAKVLAARRKEKDSYDEMVLMFNGAVLTGEKPKDVIKVLKDNGLTQAQIKSITTGQFKSEIISKKSADSYRDKELLTPRLTAEEKKEIKDKWKEIWKLLQNVQKTTDKED